MQSNADVIAFHQLLLGFTLRCSGILARPQRKGEDSRLRGGGRERDRQRREVDLSIVGFSVVVYGEMGVLMHRDNLTELPCVYCMQTNLFSHKQLA